jgi:uncharacterized protein (TIGR00255 family)
MISSMTGYGTSKQENESFSITAEIKTVNHRFCEITVRMPRPLMILEEKIKQIIKKKVRRGRTEVFISIDGSSLHKRSLEVDWDLFNQFHHSLQFAKENYNLKGELSIEHFVAFKDLYHITEQETGSEEVELLLIRAIEEASSRLSEMREVEGQSLLKDLTSNLMKIEQTVDQLSNDSQIVVQNYRDRLLKKIQDFMQGSFEIDESRILTEVAVFADKADINEELTRLKSHINQFRDSLHTEEPVGRKLDFIVQEMNREINTIGSKANESSISQRVVNMKSDVEKIKEQVQNVE